MQYFYTAFKYILIVFFTVNHYIVIAQKDVNLDWYASNIKSQMVQSHYDSALAMAIRYSNVATHQQVIPHLLTSQELLTEIYEQMGEYTKVLEFANKGLVIAKRHQLWIPQCTFLMYKSNAYMKQGMGKEAMEAGLAAKDIAAKFENLAIKAKAEEVIGNIYYFVLKDYHTASTYYEKTATYNELSQDKDLLIGILSHLGNTYYQNKEYSKALSSYQKGFLIAQSIHFLYGQGYTKDNMGLTYKALGAYKKAREAFYEALQYREATRNRLEILNTLNHLARIELHFNELNKAANFAERGLQLSKESNNYELILEALETLRLIRMEEGKTKAVVALYKEIVVYTDSLYQQKNELKVKQLVANKVIAEQEHKNQLLLQQNAHQEVQIMTKTVFMWTAVGVGVVLLLLALFLYRSNRKIQQFAETVQEQNHEIALTQQQLTLQNDELAKINQVKDKLLAVIGHDLRSPIGSMKTALELLAEQVFSPEEYVEYSLHLYPRVNALHETIDNLLQWAYLQIQTDKVFFTSFDISLIVQNTVNLLTPLAKDKGIVIDAAKVHLTNVYADATQIEIVIRNLLSNAIKFTPQNGIITIFSTQINENYLRVAIHNTGSFIESSVQKSLFMQHLNESSMGTQGEKGMGLGLLLCTEMVHNNKGEIGVESSLEDGTTFFILLPRHHNPLTNNHW